MKCLYILLLLVLTTAFSNKIIAQTYYSKDIATSKLYKVGHQTSMPIIALNGGEAMELDFDDLSNRIRNYYYTFQLCNADWTPSILHPFEYIKGFENTRISNYRNSSLAFFRYVHYQATIPERNSYPSKSGNYLLKVFLDNDTSKLVFTKRFVVVNAMSAVSAQVQQPFNSKNFNTSHKLLISVQTNNQIQVLNPGDLKVVVLQNNNWQTSLYLDRPNIYRGNYFEYNDEMVTTMPAGKEFRWLDLRSLRLKSDRMLTMESKGDTSYITAIPDKSRNGLPYIYYRDMNGSYTVTTLETINPFWQGDYAWVHFSYVPPDNRAIEGQDVYMFGEMTNYAADESGKMTFNPDKGVYEKTLLLKQGYYNYLYVTQPAGGRGYPDMIQTEGNFWGTEDRYVVLVYYRAFGSRSDEVIGYAAVNSIFQR